jgi:predicted RNase H-like HicB family nuclease
MHLEELSVIISFTFEYWRDGKWFVGRLTGVEGVFSQGKTLAELEVNIREAYHLMVEEHES